MKTKQPIATPQCATCGKQRTDECSHVECPKRKRVTAAVPANSSRAGMSSGASYRITYQDK